jgi:hypothetical protein
MNIKFTIRRALGSVQRYIRLDNTWKKVKVINNTNHDFFVLSFTEHHSYGEYSILYYFKNDSLKDTKKIICEYTYGETMLSNFVNDWKEP